MPEKTPVKEADKAVAAPAKDLEMKTASDVGIGAERDLSAFPRRFVIVWSLILIFFTAFKVHLGPFVNLNNDWVDTMFRFRGMERGEANILVVAIDDSSIEAVGSYPWPRSNYKTLIEALMKAGVSVVGLDILFLDPSTPKEDKALVDVTRKYADKIVHVGAIDARGKEFKEKGRYDFFLPFDALYKVTKHLGLATQSFVDDDGAVRTVPVFLGRQHGEFAQWPTDPDRKPSLGLQVVSVYAGKSPDDIYKEHGRSHIRINLRGEVASDIRLVDDGKGDFVALPVPSEFGFDRIPAWKLLKNELNLAEKERLKGAIILIGSTSLGAHDHFPTAFNGATPGVEVHANLIDNLLSRNYFDEANEFITYLLIVLFGFAAYRLFKLAPLVAGIGVVGLFAGWMISVYLAFMNQFLFDFWQPALAILIPFVVLMVYKTMMEAQQKQEVRAMFGQYVSPEVVDILVKDPKKLSLGGVKKDMTVFFLDIAHFTTISEKMAPEDLIKFLNRYLTALTDDILNNSGVVDKYIGDCIMAFWNAPLDVAGHRAKACLAAVSCIDTIERLNAEYVDPSMPETPAVRIGLNSGEVVVGNTGSARKLAYTVLGDEVNLSSRLEGANKFFGSTIMASEDTFNEEARRLIEGRELGKVRVVGKEIPIKVFELLGKKGELPDSWQKALPPYHDGVRLYNERKFEEAKNKFQEVLKFRPDDKPTKLYLNVCEDYIVIPPPTDQELVFNLTSK